MTVESLDDAGGECSTGIIQISVSVNAGDFAGFCLLSGQKNTFDQEAEGMTQRPFASNCNQMRDDMYCSRTASPA